MGVWSTISDPKKSGAEFAAGILAALEHRASETSAVIAPQAESISKSIEETPKIFVDKLAALAWGGKQIGQTVLALLSATTAVAAGFIYGIGFDSIAFFDKWTVISTIIFYFSVALALASPVIVIPSTLRHWAQSELDRRRSDRRDQLRRIEDEKRKAREASESAKREAARIDQDFLVATDNLQSRQPRRHKFSKEIGDMEARRVKDERWSITAMLGIRDPNAGLNKEIENKKNELRKLDAEMTDARSKLQELHDRRSGRVRQVQGLTDELNRIEIAHQETTGMFAPLRLTVMLLLANLLYIPVAVIVLNNFMPIAWAATGVAVAVLLCVLSIKFGFLFIAPTATVAFLVFGWALGINSLCHERTIAVQLERHPSQLVSVVLVMPSGWLVVADSSGPYASGHCPAGTVPGQLGFIRKELIERAVVTKNPFDRVWVRTVLSFFNSGF